ncbi:hypothetical protein [Streptomyces sp. NPDC101237]|uniref:WXG100-like domain-containing protein n=1 Tax=Streptomyces sp. NPDC101237 TaxID=3366139 RepID=UPI00380D228F
MDGDLQMPDAVASVAALIVGSDWPKGSETGLRLLGDAWAEGARQLHGLGGELGASGSGVLESVGGRIADEFRDFVTDMERMVPGLAQSAGQMSDLSEQTALQIEYAKAMIITQAILVFLQVLHFLLFGLPEAAAVELTAGRFVVSQLLKELLVSIGTGIALNEVSDVLVQVGQFIAGHRHQWDTDATVSAIESGAIGGAVGGLTFGVARQVKPRFAVSLGGKLLLSGVVGGVTEGITYGIWGGDTSAFGSAITSGFLGGLEGGHKFRFSRSFNEGYVRLNDVPSTPGRLGAAITDAIASLGTGLTGLLEAGAAAGAGASVGAGSGSPARAGAGSGSRAGAGAGAGRGTGTGTGTGRSSGAGADAGSGRGSGAGAGLPEVMTEKSQLGLTTVKNGIVSGTARTHNELTTSRDYTAPATAGGGAHADVRTESSPAATVEGWPGATLASHPVTGPLDLSSVVTYGNQTQATPATPHPDTASGTGPAAAAPRTASAATPASGAGTGTSGVRAAAAFDRPATGSNGPATSATAPGDVTSRSAPNTVRTATGPQAPTSGTRTAGEHAAAVVAPEDHGLLNFETRFPGPDTTATAVSASGTVPATPDTPPVPPRRNPPAPVHPALVTTNAYKTLVGLQSGLEKSRADLHGRITAAAEQAAEHAPLTPSERLELKEAIKGVATVVRRQGLSRSSDLDEALTRVADMVALQQQHHNAMELGQATAETILTGGRVRVKGGAAAHEADRPDAAPSASRSGPVPGPSRLQTPGAPGQNTPTTGPRPHDLVAELQKRRGPLSHDDSDADADSVWNEQSDAAPPPRAAAHVPTRFHETTPVRSDVVPERDAETPEPEHRTEHSDADEQPPAEEQAPPPPPAVLPPAPLPVGPFEARTLWGDEAFVDFGLAVRELRSDNTIRSLPMAYSHEEVAGGLAREDAHGNWPVWEYRYAAYQAVAGAAEHRLRLIVERAERTVRTKAPGDPERDRAERLLKTESSLAEDGWLPEYRSEFLHMKTLLEESGILDALPNELVVNERWNLSPESDESARTPHALVSPDDPTGPIGGSLRAPGGVSERFYAWLDDNGGNSVLLGNWSADQSSGSITTEALRFKIFMSHFRPAKEPGTFYMPGLDGTSFQHDSVPSEGHREPTKLTFFHKSYTRSIAAQHAFTHAILTRVRMPNVDPERGVVQLLRLDRRDVVEGANGDQPPADGDRINLRRGPADSYSLLEPYKDPGDISHSLGAFWVTSQEIPLHQVFGTYLQSRTRAGNEREHTLFLWDHENEFLAMSDGVESVFHGTTVPPRLPAAPATPASHPDAAAVSLRTFAEPAGGYEPPPIVRPVAEGPTAEIGHPDQDGSRPADADPPAADAIAPADAPDTLGPVPPSGSPEPDPAPAGQGGRHLRSLAGIKLVDAPWPQMVADLRGRILQTLPASRRNDQRTLLALDAEVNEVRLLDKHREMLDGWNFRIWAGKVPYDVVVTARPQGWHPVADPPLPSADGRDGFEHTATFTSAARPDKTTRMTSKGGADSGATSIDPDPVRPLLGLATLSGKVGGALHLSNTSVNRTTEATAKTTFTGPVGTYRSAFHYDVTVHGPTGRLTPRDGSLIAHDVTAEIAHVEPDGDGRTGAHPGLLAGRPLDVTGLDAVRDRVLDDLLTPAEARYGTVRKDVREFLSPRNVVDHLDTMSTGGHLISKELTLRSGHRARLELRVLRNGDSAVEGTVAGRQTFSSKTTAERADGRIDISSWSVGLSGGSAFQVWKSASASQSDWLQITGGYTYGSSLLPMTHLKQSATLEDSVEHEGRHDLLVTPVRFEVRLIRLTNPDHWSGELNLGWGNRGTATDPESAPSPLDGTIVQVRQHHPDTVSAPPADHPEQEREGTPVPRTAAPDLRDPLVAHRTAFLDVPGSRHLEEAITGRLRELDEGLLPLYGDTATGSTREALRNRAALREFLSPSALAGNGRDLLNGRYRTVIGSPGQAHEVVVRARLGRGTDEGSVLSTASRKASSTNSSTRTVMREGKHTGTLSAMARQGLIPDDTVRVMVPGGLDLSYAAADHTAVGTETQLVREFRHTGEADVFAFEVTYRVMVRPHHEDDAPGILSGDDGRHDAGTDQPIRLDGQERLRVEVRRPAPPASPPPARLTIQDLPETHRILSVEEGDFTGRATAALAGAYHSRGTGLLPGRTPPAAVPGLAKAVHDFAGEAQLTAMVDSSRQGWFNTSDLYVGKDRVGLSVRTRLTDFRYLETLTGEGTLDLEVKSSSTTGATGQTSKSVGGSFGPDFNDAPETMAGALVTNRQERLGFRGKLSGQWDSLDTIKYKATDSYKWSARSTTWHVYETTADMRITGRVSAGDGVPHFGAPVTHAPRVLVLLSDEDVARIHEASTVPDRTIESPPVAGPGPTTLRTRGPADVPPPSRSGTDSTPATTPASTPSARPGTDGTLDVPPESPTGDAPRRTPLIGTGPVWIADTDPVLHEIARQSTRQADAAQGPGPDGGVPVAALRFANAFSPANLASRWQELTTTGISETVVRTTQWGTVATTAWVRAIPGDWTDVGPRPGVSLTHDSSVTETLTGKNGRKVTRSGEVNGRVGVQTGREHLNSVLWLVSGGLERSQEIGAESGVTTTREQKTAGFGGAASAWETEVRFEVVVSEQDRTGRFVNLPAPDAVLPTGKAVTLVPDSLTTLEEPGRPVPDVAVRRDGDGADFPTTVPRDGIELDDLRAPDRQNGRPTDLNAAHSLMHFDNTADLLAGALRVHAAARPGGTGVVGQVGAYSSHVLAQGAGLVTAAARRSPLQPLIDRATTFYASFGADGRLAADHPLRLEQSLSVEDRSAIRSGLSHLNAHFDQLKGDGYRIPGTQVELRVDALGPGVEISRREATDALTVSREGESSTSNVLGAGWSVSPANFAVLTDKPLVWVPLNAPLRISRDRLTDSVEPVTMAPGAPRRDPAALTLPGGTDAPVPGRADITGTVALVRQPVRFTVRNPNGASETVLGHALVWRAVAAADTEAPASPVSGEGRLPDPRPHDAESTTRHPRGPSSDPDDARPPSPVRDDGAPSDDHAAPDSRPEPDPAPADDDAEGPAPLSAKRAGKRPEHAEDSVGGRVAQALGLRPELGEQFTNSQLVGAQSLLEAEGRLPGGSPADGPMNERRARHLLEAAEALVRRDDALPPAAGPASPVDGSGSGDPVVRPESSRPPAAEASPTDGGSAGEHPAPAARSRLATLLEAVGGNDVLYAHPTDQPAVRLRGPRESGWQARTPNQLSAAQWWIIPEGTRNSAAKERLETSLDPQTFLETDGLHSQAFADAGRAVAGFEPGSTAGNAEVLERLGRRDPQTAGYWQAQDQRDRMLGVAVRSALGAYNAQPRTLESARAAQVRAAVAAGDGRLGTMEKLLESYNGVAIGGNHKETSIWSFLTENMAELRLHTIYLESIRQDSYGRHLEHYFSDPEATMPGPLATFVRRYDDSKSFKDNGMRALLEAAHRNRVRVVGVDGRPARMPRVPRPEEPLGDRLYHRVAAMNTYTAGLIRDDRLKAPAGSRYVVELGQAHVGMYRGPVRAVNVHGSLFAQGEEFPGVDRLLGIPGVVRDGTGELRPAWDSGPEAEGGSGDGTVRERPTAPRPSGSPVGGNAVVVAMANTDDSMVNGLRRSVEEHFTRHLSGPPATSSVRSGELNRAADAAAADPAVRKLHRAFASFRPEESVHDLFYSWWHKSGGPGDPGPATWRAAHVALESLGPGTRHVVGGDLALHLQGAGVGRRPGEVDLRVPRDADLRTVREQVAAALRGAHFTVAVGGTAAAPELRVHPSGRTADPVTLKISHLGSETTATVIDGIPTASLDDVIRDAVNAATEGGGPEGFAQLSDLVSARGAEFVRSRVFADSRTTEHERVEAALRQSMGRMADDRLDAYGANSFRVRMNVQRLLDDTPRARRSNLLAPLARQARPDTVAALEVPFAERAADIDEAADTRLRALARQASHLASPDDLETVSISVEASANGYAALRRRTAGLPAVSDRANQIADDRADTMAGRRARQVVTRLVHHLTAELTTSGRGDQAHHLAERLVRAGDRLREEHLRVARVVLAKQGFDNTLRLQSPDGRALNLRDAGDMRSFVESWSRQGNLAPVRLLLHRLQRAGHAQEFRQMQQLLHDSRDVGNQMALPKKIHMYWAGKRPTDEALANIDAWAAKADAQGWRLHLWTDETFQQWPSDVRERLLQNVVVRTDSGTVVSRHGGEPASRMYELLRASGVHNIVSDLVRYGIFSDPDEGGGVYLDVDIAPGNADLRLLERVTTHPADVPVFAPQLRTFDSLRRALVTAGLEGRTDDFDQQLHWAGRHLYEAGSLNTNVIVFPSGSVFARQALDGMVLRYGRFMDDFRGRLGHSDIAAFQGQLTGMLKESAGNISGPGLLQETGYLPAGSHPLLNSYARDNLGVRSLDENGRIRPSLEGDETAVLFEPRIVDWILSLRTLTPESDNTLDGPTAADRVADGRSAGPNGALRNPSAYPVRTPGLHGPLTALIREKLAGEDPNIDEIATLARARDLASREAARRAPVARSTPTAAPRDRDEHAVDSARILLEGHFNRVLKHLTPSDATTGLDRETVRSAAEKDLAIQGLHEKLTSSGSKDELGDLFDTWWQGRTRPEPNAGETALAANVRERVGPRRPRVWDAPGLKRAVDAALTDFEARKITGGIDQETLSQQECWELLRTLAGKLFPQGIAPADSSVTDMDFGVRPAESSLVLGQWKTVNSLQTVAAAITAAGPGSTALVLIRRPDRAGHAVAAYVLPADHETGTSRVVWLDPQSPDRRISTEPPVIATAEARAVIVGREARVLDDALAHLVESSSLASTLIDRSVVHRYGAISVEVEFYQHLGRSNQSGIRYDDVVATHTSGTEIRVDTQTFWKGGDTLFLDADDAFAKGHRFPEAVDYYIPEFIPSPAAIHPGEQRSLNHESFIALTNRTHDQMSVEVPAPLSSILRPEDGWQVAPQFEGHLIHPAPQGTDRASPYTQFTVGVPVHGILPMLHLVESRGQGISEAALFSASREFGGTLARWFIEDHYGQQVGSDAVHLLSGLPQVREIWGFGWLTFNHVSATPFRNAFRPGSLVKNRLPAASRNPLGEIRAALHPAGRAFLRNNFPRIRDLFTAKLGDIFAAQGRRRPHANDILEQILSGSHDVGDYLAYAINGRTEYGESVSQFAGVGMARNKYETLENISGVPLALLELRQFGAHGGTMSEAERAVSFREISTTAQASFGENVARLASNAPGETIRRVLDDRLVSATAPLFQLALHGSERVAPSDPPAVERRDVVALARSLADRALNATALDDSALTGLRRLITIGRRAVGEGPLPDSLTRESLERAVASAQAIIGPRPLPAPPATATPSLHPPTSTGSLRPPPSHGPNASAGPSRSVAVDGAPQARRAPFSVVAERGGDTGNLSRDERHDESSAIEEAEEIERRRLEDRITDDFGIKFDNEAGVRAVTETNATADPEVHGRIKGTTWPVRALRELNSGLQHYKPILGKHRAASSRAGAEQEINTVASVNLAIRNKELFFKAAGQYIESHKIFNIYAMPHREVNRVEQTVTHELSHGLLSYALGEFGNEFWTGSQRPTTFKRTPAEDFEYAIAHRLQNPAALEQRSPRHAAAIAALEERRPGMIVKNPDEHAAGAAARIVEELGDELGWFAREVGTWTADGKPQNFFLKERPITEYGETNSDEDLAETAMMYFTDNERLREHAPLRAAFMDRLVEGWRQRHDTAASAQTDDTPSRAPFSVVHDEADGSVGGQPGPSALTASPQESRADHQQIQDRAPHVDEPTFREAHAELIALARPGQSLDERIGTVADALERDGDAQAHELAEAVRRVADVFTDQGHDRYTPELGQAIDRVVRLVAAQGNFTHSRELGQATAQTIFSGQRNRMKGGMDGANRLTKRPPQSRQYDSVTRPAPDTTSPFRPTGPSSGPVVPVLPPVHGRPVASSSTARRVHEPGPDDRVLPHGRPSGPVIPPVPHGERPSGPVIPPVPRDQGQPRPSTTQAPTTRIATTGSRNVTSGAPVVPPPSARGAGPDGGAPAGPVRPPAEPAAPLRHPQPPGRGGTKPREESWFVVPDQDDTFWDHTGSRTQQRPAPQAPVVPKPSGPAAPGPRVPVVPKPSGSAAPVPRVPHPQRPADVAHPGAGTYVATPPAHTGRILDPRKAWDMREPARSADLLAELEGLGTAYKRASEETRGDAFRELTRALDAQGPRERHWLAQQTSADPRSLMVFMSKILSPRDFSDVAARLMVHVDPRVQNAEATREAAISEMRTVLQRPHVALSLLKAGMAMGIIPKNLKIADVAPVVLHKDSTSRSYAVEKMSFVSIAEEHIARETGNPAPDTADALHLYDEHATVIHEVAHLIHFHSLSDDQKRDVLAAYQTKLDEGWRAEWSTGTRWVDRDGIRRVPYSAKNVKEYFAEAVRAYLSDGRFFDTSALHPARAGVDWTRRKEAGLLPVLEYLFGKNPEIHSPPTSMAKVWEKQHGSPKFTESARRNLDAELRRLNFRGATADFARRLAASDRAGRRTLLIETLDLPRDLDLDQDGTLMLFSDLPAHERLRLVEDMRDAQSAEFARSADREALVPELLYLPQRNLHSLFEVDGLANRRLRRQLDPQNYRRVMVELAAARHVLGNAHTAVESLFERQMASATGASAQEAFAPRSESLKVRLNFYGTLSDGDIQQLRHHSDTFDRYWRFNAKTPSPWEGFRFELQNIDDATETGRWFASNLSTHRPENIVNSLSPRQLATYSPPFLRILRDRLSLLLGDERRARLVISLLEARIRGHATAAP